MLDPLHGREQVVDHRDKRHGPEKPYPKGQADVAAQQLAEALLVYRGCLNHVMTPERKSPLRSAAKDRYYCLPLCSLITASLTSFAEPGRAFSQYLKAGFANRSI
ncbi:hypothetical protein D3C76_1451650 [compost metagenome]